MAGNLDEEKVDRRNRVDDSDEEKNQLYRTNKTKYGIVNPSLLSNGYKLKTMKYVIVRELSYTFFLQESHYLKLT